MADNSSAPQKKSIGSYLSNFNYCFWGKVVVAIPLLPFVAVLASLPFHNPYQKVIVAITAMIAVVYISKKIDSLPCLSGMIIKRKQ